MLKFLIPKEQAFFEQFDILANLGVECSGVFAEMLGHFENAQEKAKQIRDA